MPNMVGWISTDLASAGLYIVDFLNRTWRGYAYTLVDTDRVMGKELPASLKSIEGVAVSTRGFIVAP